MAYSPLTIRLRLLVGLLVWALDLWPYQAFDLQGYPGARGLAPENTLPVFVRALEIGVTTLELDVGITKDGAPVVAHPQIPVTKRWSPSLLGTCRPRTS